jgi:hypothetical protein
LPRKPNYRFERIERERQKAEKKAARAAVRAERKAVPAGAEESADESGEGDTAQDEPNLGDSDTVQD